MKTLYKKSDSFFAINGILAVNMDEAAYEKLDKDSFLTETSKEVMAYIASQEEAAKAFEAKQAAKASGLKKFAEAMPSLTTDEIKALFGG